MEVKFRHQVAYAIIRPVIGLYIKLKYKLKVTKYKTKKKSYLILSNHVSSFDPFIVAQAVKQPIYFMANEDLFSNGFVSSIIKYLVSPIPKSKSMKDLKAIKYSIKVKNAGGTICIFPEGNRTYSGLPCNIDKSIAKFAKKLNIPLLLVNIEGGFQSDPRFSDAPRKGKIAVKVVKEISPEELKEISDDELYDTIVNVLNVPLTKGVKFKSRKKAMYLERVMYYCFNCNNYQTFQSEGNYIKCKCCSYTLKYTEYNKFELIKGDYMVDDLSQYYIAQEKLLTSKGFEELSEISYTDDDITISLQKRFEKRHYISTGKLMYKNYTFIHRDKEYKFDDLQEMTCLGKNKINIYLKDGTTYQFKGEKSFCALKYMQIFYYHKHLKNGGNKDDNRIFMGL